MKIDKIKVENLFDYYSHTINLKRDSRITIIHAPNGYGKTTIFKMLSYVFALKVFELKDIPFSLYYILFEDDTSVQIKKEKIKVGYLKEAEIGVISYKIKKDNKEYSLSIPIEETLGDGVKEYGVKTYFKRLQGREKRQPQTTVLRFLSTDVELFFEVFQEIAENVDINFVESNRLYKSRDIRHEKIKDENYILRGANVKMRAGISETETILIAKRDILNRIQTARQRYSLESEKKDSNFPNRLVKAIDSTDYNAYSKKQITEQLKQLQKKRSELEETGLILGGGKGITTYKQLNEDETMCKFYTLYIKDTFEKLSVYDDIKLKLELLLDVINTKTRFSNKVLKIDNERGVVFEQLNSISEERRDIPLDKLSSGEKNDFILFYELIFNTSKNSIFLIDEPEISLHVAWQTEFVSVLEKICEINEIQAIIATHSPDIVNGRDDLLVSFE